MLYIYIYIYIEYDVVCFSRIRDPGILSTKVSSTKVPATHAQYSRREKAPWGSSVQPVRILRLQTLRTSEFTFITTSHTSNHALSLSGVLV